MGGERAEAYLRLLAEAELRRAGNQLRDLAAAESVRSDPGVERAIAERAQWTVIRAGRILVAAGVLDQDYLTGFSDDLHAAIQARSRLLLDHDRSRANLHRGTFAPVTRPPPPSGPVSWPMRVTPTGRALQAGSGRAPPALHLMSLVRTRAEAVITVAMRMHWPPDGSSTDLEITGAGRIICRTASCGRSTTRTPATRSGSRAVRAGQPPGGASPGCHPSSRPTPGGSTWSATEPASSGFPSARRPRGKTAAPSAAERVPVWPGERLLMLAAERILISGDARGPAVPRRGRDRGDRTDDAGPRNGADPPSRRNERRLTHERADRPVRNLHP